MSTGEVALCRSVLIRSSCRVVAHFGGTSVISGIWTLVPRAIGQLLLLLSLASLARDGLRVVHLLVGSEYIMSAVVRREGRLGGFRRACVLRRANVVGVVAFVRGEDLGGCVH